MSSAPSLFILDDTLLIKIFQSLNISEKKLACKVCKIFHEVISHIQNQETQTVGRTLSSRLIQNRLTLIERFLLNQVPGLLVSYRTVFDRIIQEGISVFLSGGIIRDLCGRISTTPFDVDFSFNCDVERIVEIAKGNGWKYSKRPLFPVIQIGNRKECCMQGISTTYTINCPPHALEFGLNSVFYDYRFKTIIDPTSQGCEDILYRRLKIHLKDKKKWLFGDSMGYRYNKIFRFWKLIERGFKPEASTQSFIIKQTAIAIQTDRSLFIKELIECFGKEDSRKYTLGCSYLMGKEWTERFIIPEQGKIENFRQTINRIWDSYTFQDDITS